MKMNSRGGGKERERKREKGSRGGALNVQDEGDKKGSKLSPSLFSSLRPSPCFPSFSPSLPSYLLFVLTSPFLPLHHYSSTFLPGTFFPSFLFILNIVPYSSVLFSPSSLPSSSPCLSLLLCLCTILLCLSCSLVLLSSLSLPSPSLSLPFPFASLRHANIAVLREQCKQWQHVISDPICKNHQVAQKRININDNQKR